MLAHCALWQVARLSVGPATIYLDGQWLVLWTFSRRRALFLFRHNSSRAFIVWSWTEHWTFAGCLGFHPPSPCALRRTSYDSTRMPPPSADACESIFFFSSHVDCCATRTFSQHFPRMSFLEDSRILEPDLLKVRFFIFIIYFFFVFSINQSTWLSCID